MKKKTEKKYIIIDAKKIIKEVYAECDPFDTHNTFIEKLFEKYANEINKQLQEKLNKGECCEKQCDNVKD